MSYRHVALRGARRPALLLAGAALLALPALAHAAEPAPEPVADPTLTGTLDQIVVTAQKRKTDLQKTPIAISVLSGEPWPIATSSRWSICNRAACPACASRRSIRATPR
jgi:iron complex outermembrane receptor protein